MGQTRQGSKKFSIAFGAALILSGALVWLPNVNAQLLKLGAILSGASSILFGGILVLWSCNQPEPDEKDPKYWSGGAFKKGHFDLSLYAAEMQKFHGGLGNETVTMVVAVVTGVITIFTLLHIADERPKPWRCNKPDQAGEMICTPCENSNGNCSSQTKPKPIPSSGH